MWDTCNYVGQEMHENSKKERKKLKIRGGHDLGGEDARLEQKPSLIRHLDNKGIVEHSLTWCLPFTLSLSLSTSLTASRTEMTGAVTMLLWVMLVGHR